MVVYNDMLFFFSAQPSSPAKSLTSTHSDAEVRVLYRVIIVELCQKVYILIAHLRVFLIVRLRVLPP